MTEKQADALPGRFEAIGNAEYGKFERIPENDRLHPSKVLCGYLKVASLMLIPSKFGVCAEHDCVFLPDVRKLKALSDEDIVYLSRCGIHYDREADCLADFC